MIEHLAIRVQNPILELVTRKIMMTDTPVGHTLRAPLAREREREGTDYFRSGLGRQSINPAGPLFALRIPPAPSSIHSLLFGNKVCVISHISLRSVLYITL